MRLYATFVALLQICQLCLCRTSPKGFQAKLEAKWPSTSLLHETAEFLADESAASFWSFALSWQPPQDASNAACFNEITGQASNLLTPSMARILGMSLAIRQYSPRVETFRQMAEAARTPALEGACCWATVGNESTTDPSEVPKLVRRAMVQSGSERLSDVLLPFDHIYQNPLWEGESVNISDPDLLPVLLYAPVGGKCAIDMDSALRSVADREPSVAYAWRPVTCKIARSTCDALGMGPRLGLFGYGVELAIKNMEYNARDDSASSSSPGSEASVADKAEDVFEDFGGFQFSKIIKRRPELRQELLTFRDHLVATASKETTLKVWDLKDIGLQTAQRIVSAADPLHLLREITQNFPLLVESLSKGTVNGSIRAASVKLQQQVPAASNFLLINGVEYSMNNLNLYEFLDVLRREVRLLDALAAAKLPSGVAREVAALRGTASKDGEGSTPRLDIRPDVDAGEIAWVNDLERDPEYAGMTPRLGALIQPMFMASLPTVRRNVFTTLLLVDLASPQGLEAGATVQTMQHQRWPLHMGFIPFTAQEHFDEDAIGMKTSRMFIAMAATQGGRAVTELLARCAAVLMAKEQTWVPGSERFYQALLPVAEKQFKAVWSKVVERGTGDWPTDAAEALKQSVEYSGVVGDAARRMQEEGGALIKRKGLKSMAAGGGAVILNGIVSPMDPTSSWQSTIASTWQSELQIVQSDVYLGRLTDDSEDLYSDILKLRGTVPRHNPRAFSEERSAMRVVRLNALTDGESEPRQIAISGDHFSLDALAALPVRYFGPSLDAQDDPRANGIEDDHDSKGQEGGVLPNITAVTHWVVVDATSQVGLQLALDALQHHSTVARTAVLINPKDDELTPVEEFVSSIACGVLHPASTADLVDAFAQIAGAANPGSLTYEAIDELLPEGMVVSEGMRAVMNANTARLTEAVSVYKSVIGRGLGMSSGASAVVTNGRIVPVVAAEDLVEEDFQLLSLNAVRNQFASKRLLDLLVRAGVEPGSRAAADVALAVASTLATMHSATVSHSSRGLNRLMKDYAQSPLRAASAPIGEARANSAAALHLQGVIDPLTKPAQQLAPILLFVRAALDSDIDLLLHPGTGYADLPLKTFYRFVVPDAISEWPQPEAVAHFSALPPHKTLTLGMDVPDAWLVEPVEAAHDLDNLRLEELPPGERFSSARFELEAILVTGTCLDASAIELKRWSAAHPRGVQLQLGIASSVAEVDTLVMSNLGYFQLKAAPGVWRLRLAPGRSSELYNISASSGAAGSSAYGKPGEPTLLSAPSDPIPDAPVSVPVAVTSLVNKDMLLVLRKKSERIDEDVLDPDGLYAKQKKTKGRWGKLTTTGGDKVAKSSEDEDGRIHVFTVASGHMYERLQKIMILSAVKRSSRRLKFWFIKNYMSPAMKHFVPFMARIYGFDYDKALLMLPRFVTYKWPSWLNKQTEKQRIIWAYKILFLDVLFPLGLKKVIFCDSDQVVRADLAELWDMDMGGAPYAYTPFCDTNTDMDGFRFWKQGFWKEHLRGKPYHISALYVVDLERFRATAAGDELRVIYDTLSKDPNSLANLDQDLPNYAQGSVPIKSLPQEWLWCETWCGAGSRPSAKTIDLCNNPLTKEPKLQSARRIIAEWPDLDREAQELTARVETVLAGKMTEDQLQHHTTRFMTFLEPMREGSVRTTGGNTLSETCGPDGKGASSATCQVLGKEDGEEEEGNIFLQDAAEPRSKTVSSFPTLKKALWQIGSGVNSAPATPAMSHLPSLRSPFLRKSPCCKFPSRLTPVRCAIANGPGSRISTSVIRLAAAASALLAQARTNVIAAAREVNQDEMNNEIRNSVRQMRALALVAPFAAVSGSADTFYVITKAVASFIKLYLLLLFVRVLLSWFPTFTWWEQQPWLALRQVTDPYLKLFSGLVPPLLGTIDLTPLFGFFILQFLAGALDVADDETRFWS